MRTAGANPQGIKTRLTSCKFRLDVVGKIRSLAQRYLGHATRRVGLAELGYLSHDTAGQDRRGLNPQGIEAHELVESLTVQHYLDLQMRPPVEVEGSIGLSGRKRPERPVLLVVLNASAEPGLGPSRKGQSATQPIGISNGRALVFQHALIALLLDDNARPHIRKLVVDVRICIDPGARFDLDLHVGVRGFLGHAVD